MPFIEVTMTEGRSAEQRRALISALTRAAHESVGAPFETIRVVLREVPATHFAAGDVTIAERTAIDAPRAADFPDAGNPTSALQGETP